MSTPEHREVARLLLQKAREDFSAAQVLIATADQTDHVIGFHLQQTVEKALKSVLASHAISDIDLKIPEQVASSDWLTPWPRLHEL